MDETSNEIRNKSIDDDRSKLINKRIEALRPKLLDLTRRNPLISTKFSERSNSLIRIVDEVPDLLLQSITSNAMRIIPLPDLKIDPTDENTLEFQTALMEARLNDETYLTRLDEIDQESDEAATLFAKAERQLKDRLREKLNMSPRQTKNNLSLQQHAKNHGISANYELPTEAQQSEDGRHINEDIQTLLLPDVLDRRLNALFNKEKTWKEETGISVLHAAFGFIEWEDGNNNSTQLSPLLLLPVQIEKQRTRHGQEFWAHSDEGEVQENKILAEKLSLEFNITLPEYKAQGPEKYFQEVIKQGPKNMTWRIKRWAVIGVFPSARLAMYHDLDPTEWNFAAHEIISGLFGGLECGYDAVPFGDEYDVDEPEIEKKVPYLITDADSSQFSAIVDISDGKSLAVEGPPGTGKSQTIVNTIASSLGAGKKILFVAEKSAALEVVRARLEAFGLGEYILSLQANRTSKEQVVSSIRDRIEMEPCSNPTELDNAIEQFKEARQQLKSYVDILSSYYGDTDLTIHAVLGRSIKFSHLINRLPESIKNLPIPSTKKLSLDKLENILYRCRQVEEAYCETLKNQDYWKPIQIPNIDPFQVNELLDFASQASQFFDEADNCRHELTKFKLPSELIHDKLETVKCAINNTPQSISSEEIDVVEKLITSERIENIQNYLRDAYSWRKSKNEVMQYLALELEEVPLKKLCKAKQFFQVYNLKSLKEDDLNLVISEYEKKLEHYKQAKKIYEQSISVSEVFANVPISSLTKIIELVACMSKQALVVRKQELDDPSLQSIFTKQIQKAKALKEAKNNMEERYLLSSISEADVIKHYASVLSTAGLFSFLSANYRAAKKFYKTISKNAKFKKSDAAGELWKLADWQVGVNDFCGDNSVKNIIGLYFDGIDTEFFPFEEVITFYQSIDEILPGKTHAKVKELLKYGAIDKLQHLLTIKPSHSTYKLEKYSFLDLDDKIIKAEQDLSTCLTDIEQMKRLKAIFKCPEETSKDTFIVLSERIRTLLEELVLLRNNSQARDILKSLFKAENSSEQEVEPSLKLGSILVSLDKESRDAFLYCIRNRLLSDLGALILRVQEHDAKAISSLKKIAAITEANITDWTSGMTWKGCAALMESASKDREGLVIYSRFIAAKNNLQEDGYKPIVESILSEGYSNVSEVIEACIVLDMARETYKVYGETLASYNGRSLNLLRKRLREMDRKVIELSRQRLRAELRYKAAPPHGIGVGRKSEYTELALLKNEISKKQRHISIRSLTNRASNALLELKPCWMMSPLAVAQYLQRGTVKFDLVIVDEASQMTPEDSVGALVRAKQAMIVGDTNQLPPTNFFRKVLEDEEIDEDEKVTEESILEMANSCFKPARRLRWHYRSRNSRLISFSNKHIYSDNLVVFPSAQDNHPDMGVSYIAVEGLYSSGTNPKEAKIMIDAIIKFMREHKEKSLGVVLLNQKQRDLLDDEMNYALEQWPHTREYVEAWEEHNDGLESFFIKNLENVQGDERDVIFIGTVYGREKEGAPVMQRFGPINGVAGKRRLNVLFSRAKKRIVTFSSMTAADIRAEEDGNPGVYMLKCWLEYASSGVLEGGKSLEKEPDSEFEEHVISQIKSIGCEAVPQVGVKGYSIDIGVKHPAWPHGFIMGVECDGATYHSSKSARDRDRLRQEVLEGLGWYLYRIWSTDWFENPVRETKKLRDAIENRLSELVHDE